MIKMKRANEKCSYRFNEMYLKRFSQSFIIKDEIVNQNIMESIKKQ